MSATMHREPTGSASFAQLDIRGIIGGWGTSKAYGVDDLSGRERFVYFAERDGRIKIGTSNQVAERLRSLGATLLGQLPGGFDVEKALHQRFAPYALGHEWFRDSPEIRTFIGLIDAPPASEAPEPANSGAAGPDPELLTIEEAAQVLRISARSAYRAIAAGAFPVPVFRPTPRRVLVSRVMLDRYLATGEPVRVPA